MLKRVLMSWSSGKDSAWALWRLKQDPTVELVGMFSTTNGLYDRVAMHGVRRTVVEAQAAAAGLPLELLPLPYPCTNEDYDQIMTAFLKRVQKRGVDAIAFGDLLLEDVRRYREQKMAASGIELLFPLWGADTKTLAKEMVAGGIQSVVCTIDPRVMDRALVGHWFDSEFLEALPESVDHCGENGEFHSCVVAGPMFSAPVPVEVGATVEREGFVFTDIKLSTAKVKKKTEDIDSDAVSGIAEMSETKASGLKLVSSDCSDRSVEEKEQQSETPLVSSEHCSETSVDLSDCVESKPKPLK